MPDPELLTLTQVAERLQVSRWSVHQLIWNGELPSVHLGRYHRIHARDGEGTISKRSDGRYTAAIYVTRPDGSRGRKWIYGRTRADVDGKLAELAQRVHTGAVIATRSPTLSEYLDYWIKEVAEPKLRPTTVSKYRTAIALYLRPGLGTQRLDKLTVAAVQKYLNSRRAIGDSVAKLRMIREVLSSALGRAVREELIPRNVAQLTTLPAEHRARRTAWTVAQARTFLAAAIDDPAYPVFVLALVYGMRRGEIAALRQDPHRRPRIPIGAPRTCRAHRPSSSPGRATRRRSIGMERDLLRLHHPYRSARRAAQRLAVLRPHRRSHGSPRIVFHDLRRTAATMLKGLGIPARDAQVILGHANIAVTLGIYSEVFDTEIATAVTLMDGALRGPQLDGKPHRL
jgi:excisionase family DNA binding protein